MYGFIYITTNNLNGKRYLGQCCYHKRRVDHYLGSGTRIQYAIKKYGRHNFSREIIDEAATKELLTKLEQHYLNLYQCAYKEDWYNVNPLAELPPPNLGRKHTEEHKAKMSALFKGKKRPPHVGEAVRKAQLGRVKSQESIDKHRPQVSGGNHCRAVSVTINGVTYPTVTDAIKHSGMSYYIIRKYIRS